MKKTRKLPKFKSEDHEREFWSKHDLTDYFDAKDFFPVSFPNLKPTSRSVSIRLPEHLLMSLKERSNELNVPYQSIVKKYIAEGIRRDEEK